VAKSTSQKEKAAALFLKWFTSPDQNMRFVSSTGYLPVTEQVFADHMEREIAENSNPNIQELLRTAVTVFEEYDFYIPPVFDGFNTLNGSFEDGFLDVAKQGREQYLENRKTMEPEAAYAEVAKAALKEFIAKLQ
jgi:multiple sugar transport system substrate-binding protein